MEFSFTNRLKHHSDMQDIETQASPSQVTIKEKRQTRSQSTALMQESIEHISLMIEKIKSLSRRKKVKESEGSHDTCHSCRAILNLNILLCCGQRECSRYFCFRCLNKKFDKEPKDIYNITASSFWNCVSCQGKCSCRACKDRPEATLSEFPTFQIMPSLPMKGKRGRKKRSLKIVENEEPFTDDMIKKEFTGNSFSLEIPGDFSPKEDPFQEPIHPKIEEETIETIEMAFYMPPKPKPRSKALAKKFRDEKIANEENSISFEDEVASESQDSFSVVTEQIKVEPGIVSESQRVVPSRIRQKARSKEECHMCQKFISNSNIATCSIEHCRKHYCIDCIRKIYQEDFDLFQNYNAAYWICFSCGGTCECKKCKRRRDAGSKRTKEIMSVQGELLDLQLNRKSNKLNEKRRIKYYDTLSEEEEKQVADSNVETIKLSSSFEAELNGNERKENDFQNENISKETSTKDKYLSRKKRLGQPTISYTQAPRMLF